MDIKATYNSAEEIPDTVEFRDLFTQKGDKWELTGINGMRTQADVERVQATLSTERDQHKETRSKLGVWGDLKPDEVQTQLDRIPELEAASKGTLDDAAIEEIVTRRVDGTLRSKLMPLERENKALATERDTLATENKGFKQDNTRRVVEGAIRKAAKKARLQDSAIDDALMHVPSFEVAENGDVITRDGVGVTPQMDPDGWLAEILPVKPHWQSGSAGSGATGSGGPKGVSGTNPFTHENWNATEQGRIVKEKGVEYAKKMAAAAGTTLGGRKPEPKKARV